MPHTAVMLLQLIGAAAFIIMASANVRAQVVAGDSPNTWNGAWAYGVARSIHDPEQVWREREVEQKYREVLNKIPDKKPSNDPWKNVRQAPTAADRHRPQ